MKSFLRHTAESILAQMDWQQLSSTTLVLPSHRAGLVLKDELLRLQQERHAQAAWAPSVQTLTQLQDALSPLYAEDELFTIVRLYKLYRLSVLGQSSEPMPLDLFYNWGRQLLADFTNIDVSMPAEEVPNFFANTIAAHELSEWHLDPDTVERLRQLVNVHAKSSEGSVKSHYEQLWQQMYELYKALRAQMAEQGKGYTGMRQRAVIEHWEDESVQKQIAGRTFIFVGFNYLLPAERELMQRLRDAGQARFYWDYVPDFSTNEKAFSFAQQNEALLRDKDQTADRSADRFRKADEKKQVTVMACVSREAQAQYVHRWLQENYTAKGQRIGVVICDETMLEPVIYTLPAITLPGETEPAPVNVTKGFPLRNTAVYARVLTWLNDPARGQADGYISPEIMDELEASLNTDDPTETAAQDQPAPLGWQELLILESEYQVRKIINQIRLLLTEGLDMPCTLKLLRLLIRRMMESVSMPFHGEPVTDIQIMGVLETRMLDFDRLLMLNVEEGVIPQRQADSSFIPYYLRKAYHMQTADERATIYAYNFFRLLSRTDHATLLYASADTAEGGKGMSRFLMQILYSPEFEVTRADLQEASALTSAERNIETSDMSMLSLLRPNEQGQLCKADGYRYRLSPSALNTFISCRRSFYLQYILGLKPQEDETVLFEPNTLGSFVHHTMEYLYRTYLHCNNTEPVRVQPEQIEALKDEAVLQEALYAAYVAMREIDKKEYVPEHHVGENVVIKGYVKNILDRDSKDAQTGLQIVLLEQNRMFPVSIDGVGEILTGGIIDRLDIYGSEGNEHLRVVDYKSGGYNDTTHAKKMSATWDELMESEDKGYVRQTLIYSHAVCHNNDHFGLPVEPHLYFCRRKLTDIITTIDIEQTTVSDYQTIRDTFYEALRTKAKEVLTTTEFPQCEEDKCPTFCPFFDLCGRKSKEY